MLRTITLIVEHPYKEISLDTTDVSIDSFSTKAEIDRRTCKCYVRALTGDKKDVSWVMAADDALMAYLLNSWAKDASHIVICFRHKDRPSPNTCPLESPYVSNNDLASIHTGIKQMTLSDYANGINPFTLDYIQASKEDIIVINNGVDTVSVHGQYLVDFVKRNIYQGTPPNRIHLIVDNSTIIFDNDVWFSCLLRHNKYATEFQILLLNLCTNMMTYNDRLKELHANTDLWNRLKVFLYDLQSFGDYEDSRNRLETDLEAKLYLSSVYFSPDEIQMLLKFPSGTGLNLEQVLDVWLKEKMQKAEKRTWSDFEVCASHDLAPIISSTFEIRKGYRNEKIFIKFLKQFKWEWNRKQREKNRGSV